MGEKAANVFRIREVDRRPSGGYFLSLQLAGWNGKRRSLSPMNHNLIFVCTILSSLSFFIVGEADAATIQGLGDLPGGSNVSQALGISADGSTVVGSSESSEVWGRSLGSV